MDKVMKAKATPKQFLTTMLMRKDDKTKENQIIATIIVNIWMPSDKYRPDAKVGGPGNFRPLRASTKTVSTYPQAVWAASNSLVRLENSGLKMFSSRKPSILGFHARFWAP